MSLMRLMNTVAVWLSGPIDSCCQFWDMLLVAARFEALYPGDGPTLRPMLVLLVVLALALGTRLRLTRIWVRGISI